MYNGRYAHTKMIRTFDSNHDAARLQVPHQIHEEDYLYQFLEQHPDIGPRAQSEYFTSARQSAEKVREIILRNNAPFGIASIDIDSFSLFDFASGFGMVNRHFRNVLPGAHVEACDIHPEAINFHSQYLGIDCILSTDKPLNLPNNRQYDVVLALSFFSHMPMITWGDWLSALLGRVKQGGLMIFTTHGPSSQLAKVHRLVESGNDFQFYPVSEQDDLDNATYGTSYSHPRYVMDLLSAMREYHLSEYRMGAWWGGNQDAYAIVRL